MPVGDRPIHSETLPMEENTKILLVEDDENLGALLQDYLNAKGYETVLRTNGEEGFREYSAGGYDFLILDIMMPMKDGFTLAKEIRGIDTTTPILFLTAKSMKEDTLEGFRSGADDYMVKPFSMEELLARMEAILKRTQESRDKEKELRSGVNLLGRYKFNYTDQYLELDGDRRKLTTKENDLLLLLYKNMNDLLERDVALNAIWGDDSYFTGRSMDVYIARLRKYLRDDPNLKILNVHGKGFKLVSEQGE